MRVFSTCPACGFLLLVADAAVHPNCDPVADPRAVAEKAWLEHVQAGEDAEAAKLAAIIDAPQTPRLQEAALVYASWGWPVFPLTPGGKTPLTRHGFKDASADPSQVRSWWSANPRANIGLPTGIRFDVIDIDAPRGWYSFLAMNDADAIPDVHGKVSTPSGGAHLYVEPQPGRRNTAGTLPGIDLRAEGGYVVAPPSIDHRGFAYTWQHKPSPVIGGRA